MTKMDQQVMLITSLRAFTGRVHAVYANQKEFFIVTLNDMAGHLLNLQKETLAEICARFTGKLDKGTVSDEDIAGLKAALDQLVSGGDFRLVSAGMAGSRARTRKNVAGLQPRSLVNEERKTGARDTEADRQIGETYSRLHFHPLGRQMSATLNDWVVNAVLMKARAEVAEYCCLYRIPLNEDDTLTPFSLSCVDAVLAACYRLLSNLHKEMATRYGLK